MCFLCEESFKMQKLCGFFTDLFKFVTTKPNVRVNNHAVDYLFYVSVCCHVYVYAIWQFVII
jgi:hypothetical protein